MLQLGLIAAATILVRVGSSLEGDAGSGIGFFWFAFLAGCFGTTVSVVRQTRSDPKALRELSRSWVGLLVPHLYGGLLAGLTYFLFLSGVISGTSNGTGSGGLLTSNLFPVFSVDQASERASIRAYLELRPASLTDVGKLLIWCFVAGYSECFVIGILDHLRSVTRRQAEPRGEHDPASEPDTQGTHRS